jgi:hypothetical protein
MEEKCNKCGNKLTIQEKIYYDIPKGSNLCQKCYDEYTILLTVETINNVISPNKILEEAKRVLDQLTQLIKEVEGLQLKEADGL